MKRTHKPVRKCHGCGLNLGDRCGVYEYPHDMWRHGKCPGYKNEKMLQGYLVEEEKKKVKLAKEKRKELMKQRKTEPHHQGTAPPCRTSIH